ncbi:hypothetical protein [Sandarakinorhabdus sp. DWP1-3-1]|uniref:hypothetical protein n=1 Tax=Sandarakinorhabdus sp. DWP1-3-1 TaxID=2804627 RepID=UPI003CE9B2D6
MAYLDDFCNNTLQFMQQNVVYVILPHDTTGIVEVVVEPRVPAATISNIAVGVVGGVVAGGVYKMRRRAATDTNGLNVYFCPYSNNSTKPLMLGNGALWMFTATMDGCTFGVGSQGPGSNGNVRVCHANNASQARPDIVFGGDTGRAAQGRMQAMFARSHVGPDGMLIEPASYMGDDFGQKATTFGTHAHGAAWGFRALTYRQAGNVFTHGGIVDYPVP